MGESPAYPALRWALFAPAVVVTFVGAGVVGSILAAAVGLWGEPIVGCAAAASVVLVAYLVAPSGKLIAAMTVLVVGAFAAWHLIDPPSQYPEQFGDKAYTSTYLPIAATYGGGILAWLGCLWRCGHERAVEHGPSR